MRDHGRLGLRLAVCAVLAAGAMACQESTTVPTAPSVLPVNKVGVLAIACPANQTVRALNGVKARVDYPAPTVTGGQAPVTSSRTPESGTTLPIATTQARCTARDELGQTARCNFGLRVLPAPQISATRFLAFGDSLTAGVTLASVATVLELTKSYPFKLQELLSQRFPVQTISVVNAGLSGEKATDGGSRIGGQLDGVRPDVVLIMEGTNDAGSPNYSLSSTTAALDGMVAEAQARGVDVMLATVPPIRPFGAQVTTSQEVTVLNDAIRSIAFGRGVPLVDIFAVMSQSSCVGGAPTIGLDVGGRRLPLVTTSPCIAVDNIHPTAEGYEVMAQEFLDAIVSRYDESVAAVRPDMARPPIGGIR